MSKLPDVGSGSATPVVSVIIPVYNDASRLELCLDALAAQTFPRDRYEVIVVDNGSTDGTPDVAGRRPVTLLNENEVQSSYAARNRGIDNASGAVFAFTDSDCVPDPAWIEHGIHAMEGAPADLVGGRVRFAFSEHPTGAELFDSISNMQNEINIRERNVAKTANLFVRSEVFDDVGRFPGRVTSGGDVSWTGRATGAGHRLVYADDAVVTHPARKLRALMSKQYRVGTGQPAKLPAEHRTPDRVLRNALGGIRSTQSLGHIRSRLDERGEPVSGSALVRAWSAGLAVRVAMAAGNVSTLLPNRKT